jgi:acyl-CoA hydrolase
MEDPGTKTPAESETHMTEVVLPNDANPFQVLLGGRLLYWMDIACAVTAQTHAGAIALTVSIDRITFYDRAEAGDILDIKARMTRAFNSSMEIRVEAWKRHVGQEGSSFLNEAFFTFVAVNDAKEPIRVPAIEPTTKEEEEFYEQALERKEQAKTQTRSPSRRA